jgi:hypothetical protein
LAKDGTSENPGFSSNDIQSVKPLIKNPLSVPPVQTALPLPPRQLTYCTRGGGGKAALV